MNANDIIGGALFLLFVVIVALFTTPIGMAIFGVLVAAGMSGYAYTAYSTHEPWTTCEPNKFGWREVLGYGLTDKGHFVLTREGVAGRYGVYPFVLTLSIFNRRNELVSTVAKLISRMEDDGKFIVGTYRGRSVVIDADGMFQARHVSIGESNGFDTWQVYPHQPAIPFNVPPPR